MRFVPMNQVAAGERLARSVYRLDGTLLVRAGKVLTAYEIGRLRALGFPGVYVSDPGDADWPAPDLLSDATRAAATAHVWQAFRVLQQGRRLNLATIDDAVERIIEDILSERHVLVGLADIRRHDAYTFGHSVDVCALCVVLGRDLELAMPQLRSLALGALLHDIGKLGISGEILRKPGRLTAEEWRAVREHPRMGFDLLRRYHEVPVTAAHVAYQHHERLDGSGYPRGLDGEAMHVFGRIAAVADTFDAMRATRVYRPGMPVHKVLAYLQRERGRQFAPEVVDSLTRVVAPYPVGTVVQLSTGEVGAVVRFNPGHPHQPTVRVMQDAQGRLVDGLVYRDLYEDSDLTILDVVPEVTGVADRP